jgi:hypothetical protein
MQRVATSIYFLGQAVVSIVQEIADIAIAMGLVAPTTDPRPQRNQPAGPITISNHHDCRRSHVQA